jgi:hypothetical protein
MAQAGFTPISLYFSTTAAAVPSAGNLVAGELALNTVDEKLYFKNSAGTVKLLASNATSAPVLSFSAGTTGFTPNTATSGAITLAGTLATTNGGTGLTSFTSGGVVYASSSSALATGSALVFTGTNLGIGQSSPSYKLVVNGTGTDERAIFNTANSSGSQYLVVSADTNRAITTFVPGTSTAFSNQYANPCIEASGVLGLSSATDTRFWVSNAEQMRLTTTGLGIGTNSPSWRLTVRAASSGTVGVFAFDGTFAGTGEANVGLRFYNGGSPSDIPQVLLAAYGTTNYTGNFAVRVMQGGTYPNPLLERFTVQGNTGNVGIGNSSPSQLLTIGSTTTANTTARMLGSNTAGSDTYQYSFGIDDVTDFAGIKLKFSERVSKGLQIFTASGYGFPITFAASSASTQMTLDTSGRLLVGTTSNFGGAGQFAVDQGGGATPSVHLIGTNSVGGGQRTITLTFSGIFNDTGNQYGNFARIGAAKENGTQGNSAGYFNISTTPDGGALTERVRIDSAGNVGIGVTNPGAGGYGGRLVAFNGTNYPYTYSIYSTSTSQSLLKLNYEGGTGFTNGNKAGVSFGSDQVPNGSYAAQQKWFVGINATADGVGNARLVFYDEKNSTERMSLDMSGKLLVGITSNPTGAGLASSGGIGTTNTATSRFSTVEYGSGASGSYSTITISFTVDNVNASVILEVLMTGYNFVYLDHVVGAYGSIGSSVIRNSASSGTTVSSLVSSGSGLVYTLTITTSVTHPVVKIKATSGGLSSGFTNNVLPTITFA